MGVLPMKGVLAVFCGVSITFLLVLGCAGVSRQASAEIFLFLAEALTAVLASAAFLGFLLDLMADFSR